METIAVGKKFNTKGRPMYMTNHASDVGLFKYKKGDILYGGYETELELCLFKKTGEHFIVVNSKDYDYKKDFILIGDCPINVNE